jgi:predicted hydrocarbon binding protein
MRVEALLPRIAASYPSVVGHLRQLQGELEGDQVVSTMRYVGQRVGTWVYKRDFALGARLELRDAVRRIVMPALKQVVAIELTDDVLYVTDSSFFQGAGGGNAGCQFLGGMIEGVLGGAMGRPGVVVDETRCRGAGDQHCCFVVRP